MAQRKVGKEGLAIPRVVIPIRQRTKGISQLQLAFGANQETFIAFAGSLAALRRARDDK
jgi:hypothetical protein